MYKLIEKRTAMLLCVVLVLGSHSALGSDVIFDVQAFENASTGGTGFATGLTYAEGDLITGFADPEDLWSAGEIPRWSNADGLVQNIFATGSDESGQPEGTLIGQPFSLWSQEGFTAPFGALVGQINGEYVLLGTSFSAVAPSSGELFLYYWDSNLTGNVDQIAVSFIIYSADDDSDSDGLNDTIDNCITTPNANQLDTNGDGFGNACDPDLNNDGLVNFLDISLLGQSFLTTDPDADLNGDGIVNFFDFVAFQPFFLLAPGPSCVTPD